MKKITTIIFGLGICLPLLQTHAQENDVVPQSIIIRLYVDSAQNRVQQDIQQDLLGPSVRLDTSICEAPLEQAGAGYTARTRSKDGSIIGSRPLGDLQPVTFTDSIDPKTGAMTNGIEVHSNGVVDICVPFSDQVTLIEIFEQANGKIATSINISGFIRQDESASIQENVPIEQTKDGGSIETENAIDGLSVIKWVVFTLLFLIAGIALWKFFRRIRQS